MEENLEISKSLLLRQSKFFLFFSFSLSLSEKKNRSTLSLSLPLSLFTFGVSLFRPKVSFERNRERGYDLLKAFRISL